MVSMTATTTADGKEATTASGTVTTAAGTAVSISKVHGTPPPSTRSPLSCPLESVHTSAPTSHSATRWISTHQVPAAHSQTTTYQAVQCIYYQHLSTARLIHTTHRESLNFILYSDRMLVNEIMEIFYDCFWNYLSCSISIFYLCIYKYCFYIFVLYIQQILLVDYFVSKSIINKYKKTFVFYVTLHKKKVFVIMNTVSKLNNFQSRSFLTTYYKYVVILLFSDLTCGAFINQ